MNLITELLEHQKKAVEKLKKIKISALYLEQGTGKTRTALELIKIRLDKGKINHVIWLCPCSVKENLRRDIIKHTGEEQEELITICGIETLSSSIKANMDLLKLVEKYNCYLIADESNLVKNHKAKRTQNIIRLAEKCTYKMILNGTPITRNEADLYSQWYVLDWRVLGYKSFWSFSANHLEYDDTGRIRKCLNTDYLTEKIAPYSYQVKKSEYLDLPKKTYETEYYRLTHEQIEHYDQVADDLMFELDELEPNTIYRLFNGLQNVITGFRVNTSKKNLTRTNFFKNPRENPRIETLLNTLSNISDEKVIIFCKYTQEIEDITQILNEDYGEGTAVKFDGELSQKKRQQNLDNFINNARFLVANKQCGAYGLNLQFCSYIIYYTNDWDYGTRSQSEDRVHRIGQNNNVHIIDICAAYTLDERIIDCLNRKENLVDSFKSELERLKDKNELISWITKRDFRGKKYNKKMIALDKEDLKEG
ncbi:DEAD/DEAH box helicase [Clostridium sp.]|uniref:DEAD/DEAH box helicase n=1 Tax=Clostridium sp. TaxID=1506 RepID=UPI002605112B|nr:DEAD/DEAH box helicase [Clostridium sp.]